MLNNNKNLHTYIHAERRIDAKINGIWKVNEWRKEMKQENDWKNGKYVLTIIAEHFYCLSVMMGVKTLCDLWKFAREREKQMLWKIFGNFTGSRSFKSTGILRQHCQELASHPHFHTYTHTVTFGLNGTVSACVVFRGQVYSGQNVDVDPQRWRLCVCHTYKPKQTSNSQRTCPKNVASIVTIGNKLQWNQ